MYYVACPVHPRLAWTGAFVTAIPRDPNANDRPHRQHRGKDAGSLRDTEPFKRSIAESTKAFFLTSDPHGRPLAAPGPLGSALRRLAIAPVEIALHHWQPLTNPGIDSDRAMIEWRPRQVTRDAAPPQRRR